jgi:hypothetical protein
MGGVVAGGTAALSGSGWKVPGGHGFRSACETAILGRGFQCGGGRLGYGYEVVSVSDIVGISVEVFSVCGILRSGASNVGVTDGAACSV